MDGLSSDLRHSLRSLRKAPQFTAAAVLTLAMGIGANAAIFSVVDAVLLQESPFAEPERLVMVWETDRASGTSHEPASWPDVMDLRERARTLSAVGSLLAVSATLTGAGEPERVSVLAVTPNLPDLLGVRPVAGRGFEAGAGVPGGERIALLSEEYWRRRFGGDPGVLGSALTLDGLPTTVVGVLPADADLGIRQVHARADYSAPLAGPKVEVWLAAEPSPEQFPRQTHPFLTLGRLAPGASLEAAQDELAGVMAELEREYPENAERGVNLEPYETVTFGPVRPALQVLLGAVALVLLVACVNVANLMLARATVRSRELAVRRALGAGAGRIARQFLVESAVLTGLGAAAGVALAHAGLRVLIALAPADIPRLAAAGLDGRVLAFTAAVAAAVALGSGLVPLLQARRLDLQGALKARAGRGAAAGREGRRLRGALVVAEVALAVALVIGAGLLLRSFWALSGVDPGFRTEKVLKAEYQLPETRYPIDFSRWPDLPEIHGFHAELLRRVRALPGVEAAAIAGRHPLDPGFTNSFAVVGREAEAADWPEIRCRFVTPGYLETMGVPLVAGRAIAEGDVAGAPPVGVVNRAAAERYFEGRDPVGQELRFWGVTWRIVGVVGDERFHGLAEDSEPAIYAPILQAPQQGAVLLARTAGDPRALAGPLRRIVHELDPQLALHGVEPLEETAAASIARPRFTAALLGLFGLVAILLALVGVHGVLSYTVAQRGPEVAVRMALGATRRDVVGLVVRDGAALAALGTALGLAGALAGSRLLASLVFGVTHHDAATFLGVAAAVMAAAGLASWLPARRAARAEAAAVLRGE
jgi:predicted permease